MEPKDIGVGWLFDSIREAAVVADVESQKILLWNKSAEDLFGYTLEEATRLSVSALVPLDFRERHIAGFSRYRATGKGAVIDSKKPAEFKALLKSGALLDVELSLVSLPLEAVGGRKLLLALMRDVSERKRLEREQVENNLLERMTDSFSALDRNMVFTYVNAKALVNIGLPREQVIGKNIYDVVPHVRGTPIEAKIREALETGLPMEYEGYFRMYDRHFNVRIYPCPQGVTIFGADVTERVKSNELLHYQVFHDSLTGLSNRALFLDRLTHLLQTTQRSGATFALLFLDLVGFKSVNDNHGHAVGDAVLKQVGQRLQAALREIDTIARFGGDEFAVLITDVDAEKAHLIGGRIVETLAATFKVDNRVIHIGVNIGIVLYPEHAQDIDALMRRADRTMYVAKREGLGVLLYDRNNGVGLASIPPPSQDCFDQSPG